MAWLSAAGRWWWHWLVVAARPPATAGTWVWAHDLALAAVAVAVLALMLLLRARKRWAVVFVAAVAWGGAGVGTLVTAGPGHTPSPAPLQLVASFTRSPSDSSRVVFRVSGVNRIPPTFNGDRVLGQTAFAVPYPPPQSPPTALPLVPNTTTAGGPAGLPGVTIHAVVPIAGLAAVVPSTPVPPPATGPVATVGNGFYAAGLSTLSPRKRGTVAVQAAGIPDQFGWSLSTPLHRGDQRLYTDALAVAHTTPKAAAAPTVGLVRTDEAWIATHMRYSLAPEHVPHGWNPVAWALFHAHHGWCAVAATAFAELWEEQTGLSADVVIGWLVPHSGVVLAKDAHAWVQLSHVRGVQGSPVALDPTAVLHRVPKPTLPTTPAVALSAGLLVLAVGAVWLRRRSPLQKLERRARHQLGRQRRPDEALGAFVAEAGLDPTPAWRVWDATPGRR